MIQSAVESKASLAESFRTMPRSAKLNFISNSEKISFTYLRGVLYLPWMGGRKLDQECPSSQ
jgi:hypothetical protein